MVSDVYGQFLRFTVTESAAATLTEGNPILTGASPRLGADNFLAIEIHNILGYVSDPQDSPAATTLETVAGAISTRSGLATMPGLSDESCIYKTEYKLRGGVATYIPVVDRQAHMPSYASFIPPLLVSHSRLYPYVLSSNSSNAGYFTGYIFYNYVEIGGSLAVEALEAFR